MPICIKDKREIFCINSNCMYNLVAHLNLLHHYKPKEKRDRKGERDDSQKL